MCRGAFDVPNEVLFNIHMNSEEVNSFARKVVALEVYRSETWIKVDNFAVGIDRKMYRARLHAG